MEDRYRSLQDMLRLPCGGGEVLVYAPLLRRPWLLSHDEVSTLGRCGSFATLHEHASRLHGPVVSATAPLGETVKALRALCDKGLLVSERELGAALRAVAREEPPPPPIRTLGFPTRGRPEMALETVRSFAAARGTDGPLDIVVGHDAETPAAASALAAALAGLTLPPQVRLRYSGPAERAAFAARLAARAGVDPALVSWGLERQHPTLWSTGACRNAMVLDCAGELSLQVDDDVRSECAPPPVAEPGLALTTGGGVMQLWFPDAGDDAESLVDMAPADVVLRHQTLLGRLVASCLSEAEWLDLDDASAAFIRAVLGGRGRVRVSQMGLAGDAAAGSLGHYLLLRGPSRERLCITERIFHHGFTSRQLVRACLRPAITDGTFCMSFALGLDGRRPLCPFMPTARNGDGIFGFVLRQCLPDSYIGFLSEVVAHRPPPRTYSFDQLAVDVRQIDSNDILCRLISHSGVAGGSDEDDGLGALGAYLERLGDLPLADFEELVWTTVLRTRSRDLAIVRETLEHFNARPSFWADELDRLLVNMSNAVLEPSHTHPKDLQTVYGEAEGRAELQRVVRRYGRLLGAWPELDAAARALREDGERASRPLRS